MGIRLKMNAIYYGGTIMDQKDDKGNVTGKASYLSFVQVNTDKNKMEQILTTFKGDISTKNNNQDGTIKGAGLIAGREYTLDMDLNVTNEKDKDGNQKAVRHILYGFEPVAKAAVQTSIK